MTLQTFLIVLGIGYLVFLIGVWRFMRKDGIKGNEYIGLFVVPLIPTFIMYVMASDIYVINQAGNPEDCTVETYYSYFTFSMEGENGKELSPSVSVFGYCIVNNTNYRAMINPVRYDNDPSFYDNDQAMRVPPYGVAKCPSKIDFMNGRVPPRSISSKSSSEVRYQLVMEHVRSPLLQGR